jgi:hypothetical protein
MDGRADSVMDNFGTTKQPKKKRKPGRDETRRKRQRRRINPGRLDKLAW